MALGRGPVPLVRRGSGAPATSSSGPLSTGLARPYMRGANSSTVSLSWKTPTTTRSGCRAAPSPLK